MTFFGVCYSPYHRTNEPPPSGVTEADVDADMAIIAARGFTHIRTYGVDGGNQWNVEKATKHRLTLGLGVWADPNSLQNTKTQIDNALTQAQIAANRYKVRLNLDLVIGNEVNRTETVYTPDLIRNSMAYAKAELPRYPGVTARVTTCFSGTVLQYPNSPWEKVVDFCDQVAYLTVYPWYGGAAPDNIDPQMKWSWDNGLKQVRERGKEVVIAEIGWPSAGGRETSPENEKINYEVTKKWVSGQNFLGIAFDTFWFEMFDEPWKTNEGPQGPHWGLYTSGSNPQPKFDF